MRTRPLPLRTRWPLSVLGPALFLLAVSAAPSAAQVASGSAAAHSSTELFSELREAGGVHPLAQLVCFPEVGQSQDTTFVLVAFSKDLASTLSAKGQPVAKEFTDAASAPEKDRFIMQWVFRNGVQLQKDPEMLAAVIGSSGAMWFADYESPAQKQPLSIRMVFSRTGRYSRDVLVNGAVTASVNGRCEPVDK
jgi:hypothetical protein